MSTKWIALVDDDSIQRFIFKETFTKLDPGLEVLFFNGSNEGLAYLNQNLGHPDKLPRVIFLDIFMPVADGWHFLEHLKAINQVLVNPIDVCIVSTSIDSRDRDKATNYKAVKHFLTKPVNSDDYKKVLVEYFSISN
ncbi:response regulator [bacterium]|nr:response regulator [bacterium]